LHYLSAHVRASGEPGQFGALKGGAGRYPIGLPNTAKPTTRIVPDTRLQHPLMMLAATIVAARSDIPLPSHTRVNPSQMSRVRAINGLQKVNADAFAAVCGRC
jgi:hypothetical protein